MSDAWNSIMGDPPDVGQRIENAVVLMHEALGKTPAPKRVNFYVKRLLPISCKELFEVLEQQADKCKCPSPAEIREIVALLKRQSAPAPVAPELTEDERTRSRQAALKTALWLHYEHHWALATFGNHMMGAALKKQESLTDAQLLAALEQAKHKYPREQIAAWMEAQS
jgi:hypothetical protein